MSAFVCMYVMVLEGFVFFLSLFLPPSSFVNSDLQNSYIKEILIKSFPNHSLRVLQFSTNSK